jgi:uncharacterized protein (TIGR02391 family)
MKTVPPFSGQQLESIAKVLGHTDSGLTGSEIAHLLSECGVPDISPDMTKWKRLYNALVDYQNNKGYGNHVVGFIHKAMNPVRYTNWQQEFDLRRDALNRILAFAGLKLGEDGKLRWAVKASTIPEAKEMANRLHAALEARSVHRDVLSFCRAEILQENYFHAVFEAMKSISSKIRALSGLTTDGAELVQQAFALGSQCNPLLAINPLQTETDKGEQKGFVNLLVGLFGVIRNPLAHNPKIEWEMNEQDALDVLTMISLLHRKLDKAIRHRQ